MRKILFLYFFLLISITNIYAESDNRLVNLAGDMAGGGIDVALKIGGGISLIAIIIGVVVYVIKNK